MNTSWADQVLHLNETYPEVGGVVGFAGVAIAMVVLIGIDLRLTRDRRLLRRDARRFRPEAITGDSRDTDRVGRAI